MVTAEIGPTSIRLVEMAGEQPCTPFVTDSASLVLDLRPGQSNSSTATGSSNAMTKIVKLPIKSGKRSNPTDYWYKTVFPTALSAVQVLYSLHDTAVMKDTEIERPHIHIVGLDSQAEERIIVALVILLAFWDVDMRATLMPGKQCADTGATPPNQTKQDVRQRAATIQEFHNHPALSKRLLKEVSNFFSSCGRGDGGWHQWWNNH